MGAGRQRKIIIFKLTSLLIRFCLFMLLGGLYQTGEVSHFCKYARSLCTLFFVITSGHSVCKTVDVDTSHHDKDQTELQNSHLDFPHPQIYWRFGDSICICAVKEEKPLSGCIYT